MSQAAIFDAENWFSSHCTGARNLSPETLRIVTNFALLWNLFEGLLCDNHAGIAAFEDISKQISVRGVAPPDLANAIAFYQFRYVGPEGMRPRFNGLNFRRNDRRELVEEVLLGADTKFESQLMSLLIIVYRLRNNLFHGLKSIDMLNDQGQNLDMACRVLASILELSDSYMIHKPTIEHSQDRHKN
jgi:hypothetical protein